MLPPITGTPLPRPPWWGFSLDEVLQYYDGPRLMLRRSDSGQLYLAWWNDADHSTDRWLYLPLSESRLWDILVGEIPCRDALDDPEDGYLLVIDAEGDVDDVIQTIITNASALPGDSLPMPGATLGVSEPVARDIIGNAAETADKARPYDYDASTSTVAVPAPHVLLLLRGLISGSEVVAKQLAALEAVGIAVILGANGPHPDAVNNFAHTIPVMNELGNVITSLASAALREGQPYYYDAFTGRLAVPCSEIAQLYVGLRGLEITTNALFDEIEKHQLLDESSGLDVSVMEDWNRAIRIITSLNDFIGSQRGAPALPKSPANGELAVDITGLFQEINEFLLQNSTLKLPAP